MKKFIAVAAALLFPLAASAACTYTTDGGSSTTKVVCTATTEAAPTLVTEGRSLEGLSGLFVVATASSAWTAGSLQAYIWSTAAGVWVRAPQYDLTTTAVTGTAWTQLPVYVAHGRIDFKPTGVGAVTTTIYMIGQAR